MKVVKANKELKKQWGDLRRQITPRIGQLTNDDQSIARIVCSFYAMLSCVSLISHLEQTIDTNMQTFRRSSAASHTLSCPLVFPSQGYYSPSGD
jgi:hypothetical protein